MYLLSRIHLLLRDIHVKLLTQYDCKEVCAPSQSQVNVGVSDRLCSQDDVSQQQGPAPLSLPQINLLFEASFVRDESSVSNAERMVDTVEDSVLRTEMAGLESQDEDANVSTSLSR